MSVTDTLSVTGRPRVTIKEQRVFDAVAPPKDESVLCSNCYFVAAQLLCSCVVNSVFHVGRRVGDAMKICTQDIVSTRAP